MANNEFLVSVADAILRDPTTGDALAYGTANLNSSFTMSMQKTDVRGGKNNPLLYTYFHDRTVEIKIEQATFNQTILALNAGTNILSGAVSVLKTECFVTSSSGSATLAETPIGDVSCILANGTVDVVTPTAKVITITSADDQRITAIYTYSDTVDRVTVESITPPTVVDLTLLAEVRDNTGVITYNLQINIPRFQISGNYTMSLAANGVSSQAVDGVALVTAATDCSGGDYYATVSWIPASATSIPIAYIVAVPSPITISVAGGLPATQQLTTLGIRGGVYQNLVMTSSASYVKAAGGSANITVSAGGLITAGSSGSSTNTATINVSFEDPTSGTLTDSVIVTLAP